ncbi:MAG TPA: beta-ketoacyl-ACP synthase III [Rhizobacter sp.]
MSLQNVYVTGISRYLPNRPVENDAMEDYLGLIGGKSSRTKAIVLRNNGIVQRYYALEKGGHPTHTNALMTAEAVRGLFDERFTSRDLQLLACGTASPDQLVPSHAAMVHGLLPAVPHLELASFAGSCAASMQALKLAQMSIATGNTANAVCTGSEMLSHWMLAKFFQPEIDRERQLNANPMLSFDKEFLRWMLSDGAGALRLENQPRGARPLKLEWVDVRSYANEAETCMYVGAEKGKDGELRGWSRFEPEDWLARSIFSVKQDTRLLGERMIRYGIQFALETAQRHDFDVATIDHFLPHLSSELFREPMYAGLRDAGLHIPQDKWFTNLAQVGNVATASFILMLEELARTRELKTGQRIMVFVPESARFSYAAALLTVC